MAEDKHVGSVSSGGYGAGVLPADPEDSGRVSPRGYGAGVLPADPDGSGRVSLRGSGKCRRICLVLAILWMVLIFAMSSRTGDESAGDSHRIGRMVGRIIFSDFEEWEPEAQENFAQAVDFPIRKGCHAGEYAVLALLILGAMGISRPFRNHGIPSWLLTTLYAASDEAHQLLVPGRAGQLRDVCIDSGGALLGLLLVWCVYSLRNRRQIRYEE